MDAPPTFKRRSDGHARFAGNALMIAGLLVLVYALDLQGGIPGLVARLGALAAVVPTPSVVRRRRWTGSLSSGRWMPG